MLSARILRQSSRAVSAVAARSLRASVLSVARPMPRYFTSSVRRLTNDQLKLVLDSELAVTEQTPNALDPKHESFAKNRDFTVESTEGSTKVQLISPPSASGEIVRVFFDIEEVTDTPGPEEEMEDSETQYEDEMDALDGMMSSVHVVVENPKENTALLFNLMLQNGDLFYVDSIQHKLDAASFLNSAAPGNHPEFIDPTQYHGPEFSDLDESLQAEFEQYLQERGIDLEFADYLIAYSVHKEENAYRGWLKSIASFV